MINPFIVAYVYIRNLLPLKLFLKKLIKKSNLKPMKIILPNGTEIEGYYSEKPILLAPHIENVYPMTDAELKLKVKKINSCKEIILDVQSSSLQKREI